MEGFMKGTTLFQWRWKCTIAPRHDMDRFIKECSFFSNDRRSGGHLFLYFFIKFLSSVLVLFFNVL
jgi:hypothetical protein